MDTPNSLTENEATMILLNDWMEQARDLGQDRLLDILEAVRSEVVFEMHFAAGYDPVNNHWRRSME